jgi:hypothetical protein
MKSTPGLEPNLTALADRNAALEAVRNIWRKMREADAQEIQKAIEEVIRTSRIAS